VKSRDDIGKSGAKTLLQMFRAQYGGENSAAFRKAQRAFACSQAAYAVVSYLLLIKVEELCEMASLIARLVANRRIGVHSFLVM
jgi:hypothetical protein